MWASLRDTVGRSTVLYCVVRVACGGTALEPEVVAQLLGRSRRQDAGVPHPARGGAAGADGRGRTNGAISRQLVVSDGAIKKHVSNIFAELGPAPSDGDHRRVLAMPTYVNSCGGQPATSRLAQPPQENRKRAGAPPLVSLHRRLSGT
jgi:hypothetical protein